MFFYLFDIFQKDILSGLEILVIELTINIYMYIYREEEFSECVGKTDPKAGKKSTVGYLQTSSSPSHKNF